MVWDEKIGILLDFVGILKIGGEVGFFSWCVDKSAIGSAAFPVHAISFCHPPIPYIYGISTFFRGISNRTNVR